MVLLISKRKLKSKPQVLQRAAVIHDEQSGLHFDVQTDLYLFTPKVGSILQGTVNYIQNTTHLLIWDAWFMGASTQQYFEDQKGAVRERAEWKEDRVLGLR